MKYKILTVITLLFTMTMFTAVSGATAISDYDYTIYDNEGYNLTTGEHYNDINLSRTNRVEIARDSLDGVIYFDTDDFSHVLFFDAYNTYMGYYNGNGSTLELSTYIGDIVVSGTDFVVPVPDRARKFALMNYNYNDTRNLPAYTQPSIDVDAWGGLTYRDIFSGTNLITNGDFENTTTETIESYNQFNQILEQGAVSTSTGVYTAGSQPYTSHPDFIDVLPSWSYNLSWEDTSELYLFEYDSSYNYLGYYNWSGDTSRAYATAPSVEYIRFVLTDFLDIGELVQLTSGSSLLPYLPHFIDIETPDNWDIPVSAGRVEDSTLILEGDEYRDNINIIQTIIPFNIAHDYYVSMDVNTDTYLNSLRFTLSGSTQSIWSDISNLNTWVRYSDIFTPTGSFPDFQPYYFYIDEAQQDLATLYIDDIMAYDLTDIFGTLDYPTTEQFEDMLDYYVKYKDVSGAVLTYADIFINNDVLNYSFDNGLDDWSPSESNTTEYGVINGVAYFTRAVGASAYQFLQSSHSLESNHYYYTAFKSISDEAESVGIGVAGLNSVRNCCASAELLTVSRLWISTYDLSGQSFRINEIGTTYTRRYIDDIWNLDLSLIFPNTEEDISVEFMDAGVIIWTDPLADDYPAYYPAGSLIGNSVWYEYDDTPDVPADATTTIDSTLTDIGVDTPQEKLFGAFLIMAIVAVLLGLKFKSFAVVIIAEIALIFIFTMLGFFGIWFLLIVAIIFVLLILLKALKGGS